MLPPIKNKTKNPIFVYFWGGGRGKDRKGEHVVIECVVPQSHPSAVAKDTHTDSLPSFK